MCYTTEWLKSWGQQLNLPVFDQILYSCAEIQTLDGPNLKTKDPCSKLNNVFQGLESNFKCLYLAKEWVQMVKKCVLVGGQDARTLALIKYHKCEVAVAPNWLQYFDKETLNFRNFVSTNWKTKKLARGNVNYFIYVSYQSRRKVWKSGGTSSN